jgi:hypothetical protein
MVTRAPLDIDSEIRRFREDLHLLWDIVSPARYLFAAVASGPKTRRGRVDMHAYYESLVESTHVMQTCVRRMRFARHDDDDDDVSRRSDDASFKENIAPRHNNARRRSGRQGTARRMTLTRVLEKFRLSCAVVLSGTRIIAQRNRSLHMELILVEDLWNASRLINTSLVE